MDKAYGIVTGASRGLGVGCARELARRGLNLVITYIVNEDKANQVAAQLRKEYGVEIAIFRYSAENPNIAKELVEFAVKMFGENLQVLINNAGIHTTGDCVDVAPEMFAHFMHVNVCGPYNVCHYAIPYMVKNHYGKIINLCSAAGLRGFQNSSAYCSSKFAVRGLTQCLALELAPHNIQVNAIAPGTHRTDMTMKCDPEMIKQRMAMNPLGRMGEVTEMDKLVAYFMDSDFINGQVISPNGGTTMV